MFGWLFGKGYKEIEKKTHEGFISVKKDMEHVGNWIKHLDTKDKQLLKEVEAVKKDLSSVKFMLSQMHEHLDGHKNEQKYERVFEKMAVVGKQTADYDVEIPVQTGVQTANIHGILKGLTANERLLVITLMNSDMKLSYEDLALLLGKERATVRGQVNSVKQKCEGLIEEITEKNGKKRVFVSDEVRNKLAKYAKVRVSSGRKRGKNDEKQEKSET